MTSAELKSLLKSKAPTSSHRWTSQSFDVESGPNFWRCQVTGVKLDGKNVWLRMHRGARIARTKRERKLIGQIVMATRREHRLPQAKAEYFASPGGEITVTLTRIGRALDPHDGLRMAFAAIVDEVTAQLGLASDSDPRVSWVYAQKPGGDGFEIEVTW